MRFAGSSLPVSPTLWCALVDAMVRYGAPRGAGALLHPEQVAQLKEEAIIQALKIAETERIRFSG